jgi:hypothetical protein
MSPASQSQGRKNKRGFRLVRSYELCQIAPNRGGRPISGGTPEAGMERTLVDTSQTLDFDITMTVDSESGSVTDGILMVLVTNTVELHNLGVSNNDGLVFVHFFGGLSFSFTADSSGAMSGFLDGGSVTTELGSIMLAVDIQDYEIAPGPAIIPIARCGAP